MVFAKNTTADLAGLVKELDKLVAEKKDSKLTSVVNLVADNPDDLKEGVKKFAEENELKNLSVTVTKPDGAKNFKLNPEAELTVMVYKDKQITANHAVKSVTELDKKLIEAIVADATKAAAE